MGRGFEERMMLIFENSIGTSLVQWLRLAQYRGPGFKPWSGNQIPQAATESSRGAAKRPCLQPRSRVPRLDPAQSVNERMRKKESVVMVARL